MAVGQVSFHSDKQVSAPFDSSSSPAEQPWCIGQKRFLCSTFISFSLLNIIVVHVPKRDNPIVNRLNKTKFEKEVDHEQERVDRVKKENAEKRFIAAQKVSLPPNLVLQNADLEYRKKLKQS